MTRDIRDRLGLFTELPPGVIDVQRLALNLDQVADLGLCRAKVCSIPHMGISRANHPDMGSIAYQEPRLPCEILKSHCTEISDTAPQDGEFAVPLQSLDATRPIQQFFACVTSEFQDQEVEWDEIMPVVHSERADAIRLDFYVWPLLICERHRGGKTLLRHSIQYLQGRGQSQ